jgi:CCR4-NOT transcription complex subunit 2
MRSAQNGLSNPSLFTNPQNSQQAGPISQASSKQNSFPGQQRQPQQQPSYAGDFVDSPQTTQISDNVGLSLSGMSDMERFGLTGLLGMIRNESQDLGMLAVGQDLTQLGLNLNQPEYGVRSM